MSDTPQPEQRSWTDPNEKVDYTVSLMLTDEQGNKWWQFDEPARMPAMRGLAGEDAAEWAKLRLTPEDFDAYYDQMIAHYNKGEISAIAHLLHRMKDRKDHMAFKKALREVAKVYYLFGDEPIGTMSEHHNALKEEAWAKDGNLAGFFLRAAFVLTHGYAEFGGVDILTYLRHLERIPLLTPEPPKPSEEKTGRSSRLRSFVANAKGSTSTPSPSAGASTAK